MGKAETYTKREWGVCGVTDDDDDDESKDDDDEGDREKRYSLIGPHFKELLSCALCVCTYY